MSIHASVWFTSWRDNSSAKRGYRSSAFSGSFVPGLIIGSGLFFISAVMLYHRVGISASGSMNFFLFSIVLYSLIELLHVYRSLISPQLYLLIIISSHHHIITSSWSTRFARDCSRGYFPPRWHQSPLPPPCSRYRAPTCPRRGYAPACSIPSVSGR